MKRTLLLIFTLLSLIAIEILRVYFIMPFPGSQRANTIDIAYFINKYIWWFRIAGWVLLFVLALYALRHAKIWKKITLIFFILLYGAVFITLLGYFIFGRKLYCKYLTKGFFIFTQIKCNI